MNLVSPNGASSVDWIPGSLATRGQQQLKWYKVRSEQNKNNNPSVIQELLELKLILGWNLQAYFDAPGGNEPLALDLRSMGKGQAWVNGQSIGRYWMAYVNGDCSGCSYLGTYRPSKCQLGCGQPTQRWYCSVKGYNYCQRLSYIQHTITYHMAD